MTRRSPLHDRHAHLGARFVDFGGWEMPVQYSSVLEEHRAVRQRVGVFDVSHLGRLSVSGDGAPTALRSLFTNDASGYEPGRTHYTMLLNESGGIVDDLVVWRWEEDEFWVMPNAANSPRVADEITRRGATVRDLRDDTVMLAVQGPEAPALIEQVTGREPARFRTFQTETERGAGTGYTGEPGGEICTDPRRAGVLLDALLEGGAIPCGLGSRDTLRLEAGLALWGADIDETTTPLEAGLGFAVSWDHDFPGKERLAAQRESGVTRRLTGVVMEERGIPRAGYRVRSGSSGGEVTSGNLSPMLDTGIGLAYLSPPAAADAPAEVEIRGRWLAARVARPPFHR
ncbi:MAG: glycine cleavage system aminomethyltransferase GcvT [Actinomycetota bacterium]